MRRLGSFPDPDGLSQLLLRHLTRYRMSRAAEYLRSTKAGVREIARLTGYDSEVSITKAFKRQFGVSPGAYRRANVDAAETGAAVNPQRY
jgi:transcriptional regulator GlxA family with amidase domain